MSREIKNKLADEICNLLYNDPHGWRFNRHRAIYKDLYIWIANRKYADLIIENAGEERIGGWWNRRKVRNAMTWAKSEQTKALAGGEARNN